MSDINKSSDEFFGGGSGESVARLTSIWEQHGRVILGAVAALVVAGGLYFLYSQSAVKAENAASEKAGAANLMFWQGDYERSKTTALEVAKSAGSTESGNTYAQEYLASGGQRPSQWCLFQNRDGVTAEYKVRL